MDPTQVDTEQEITDADFDAAPQAPPTAEPTDKPDDQQEPAPTTPPAEEAKPEPAKPALDVDKALEILGMPKPDEPKAPEPETRYDSRIQELTQQAKERDAEIERLRGLVGASSLDINALTKAALAADPSLDPASIQEDLKGIIPVMQAVAAQASQELKAEINALRAENQELKGHTESIETRHALAELDAYTAKLGYGKFDDVKAMVERLHQANGSPAGMSNVKGIKIYLHALSDMNGDARRAGEEEGVKLALGHAAAKPPTPGGTAAPTTKSLEEMSFDELESSLGFSPLDNG